MNASTWTPWTFSGVGCHCEPMPERFHCAMFNATSGAAKRTLSVEPFAITSIRNVSKNVAVSGPFASRFTVWMYSIMPPQVPCGSVLVAEEAVKERAPQKRIASHLRLCSRALRFASLAGSRPPTFSIAVLVAGVRGRGCDRTDPACDDECVGRDRDDPHRLARAHVADQVVAGDDLALP